MTESEICQVCDKLDTDAHSAKWLKRGSFWDVGTGRRYVCRKCEARDAGSYAADILETRYPREREVVSIDIGTMRLPKGWDRP